MLERLPDEVSVYEVSPRDGLQNEAKPIPLAGKIELVRALVRAGLRRIELTSYVSPRWVPQLADAEELIAAAHASCFTMALSAELGKANLVPERLRTTCTVTLDKADGGWSVTESHLELTAKVPGASEDAFRTAAAAAETGCPISKLLKTKITLDARLEP